jgi:hypothetical protein
MAPSVRTLWGVTLVVLTVGLVGHFWSDYMSPERQLNRARAELLVAYAAWNHEVQQVTDRPSSERDRLAKKYGVDRLIHAVDALGGESARIKALALSSR